MLKIVGLLLVLVVAYTYAASNNVCLYSGTTTLKPLKLTQQNCPLKKAKGCMFEVYNYNNFRYNGPVSLEPQLGEIVMFLTQDWNGVLDAVMLMNPVSNTKVDTNLTITGAAPTTSILIDDAPEGSFDNNTNTGKFSYYVEPGKTDGFIVGHINFLEKYCITASFRPVDAKDMTKVSIMTGNVTNPVRIVQQPFASGVDFSFCQYPGTAVTKTDAQCPGDRGSATVSITFGPPANTIVWRNSAGAIVSSSMSLTNALPGIYTFNMDADGCTAENQVEIMGYESPAVDIQSTAATESTKGSATVQVMAGGSAPFNFVWRNSNGVLVPDVQSGSMSTATGLNAGTYKVNITDGCGVSTLVDVVVKLISLNCSAGTYKSGNMCVVCPVGMFNNVAGATACKTCGQNKMSPGGNICVPCNISFYSAPGSGKCTTCPAGTERPFSAENCTACAPGTVRCGGTRKCQPCPLGSYAASSGMTGCIPCDPGMYAGVKGSTSCTTCPVGSYSMAGASSCTSCPAGLSAPAGSTVMQHCM